MTKRNMKDERVDVLYTFHLACIHPTPKDIVEWTKHYPQYADDIREHAEQILSQSARAQLERVEPDQAMLARGRSEAMNAIYEAEQSATASEDRKLAVGFTEPLVMKNVKVQAPLTSEAVDFTRLLETKSVPIPTLARYIGIDRGVIAELAAGRMRLPIGERLLTALSAALQISLDQVIEAVQRSLQFPRLGNAKAHVTPTVVVRSYDEIISESTKMTDEQKRYWLGHSTSWTPGRISD